jgi:hypothetical protein
MELTINPIIVIEPIRSRYIAMVSPPGGGGYQVRPGPVVATI